jgi:hypothetical protein
MESLANDTDGLENSLKYSKCDQTEKMWIRLKGM